MTGILNYLRKLLPGQQLFTNRGQQKRKRPGGTSGTFLLLRNRVLRQCEMAANIGEFIRDWNFWSSLLK